MLFNHNFGDTRPTNSTISLKHIPWHQPSPAEALLSSSGYLIRRIQIEEKPHLRHAQSVTAILRLVQAANEFANDTVVGLVNIQMA